MQNSKDDSLCVHRLAGDHLPAVWQYFLGFLQGERASCLEVFGCLRRYFQQRFQRAAYIKLDICVLVEEVFILGNLDKTFLNDPFGYNEYLFEGKEDPRYGCVEAMLKYIGDNGTLIAHHADFEKTRYEMVNDLPISREQKDALLHISERFMDTETPFK